MEGARILAGVRFCPKARDAAVQGQLLIDVGRDTVHRADRHQGAHNVVDGGDAVVLVDARTQEGTVAAFGGAYLADCLYVKTEFLKKHPDLIRGIIEARRKAVEFIKSNPDESAKIMAKEYKITEAEAKAAIQDVLSGGGVYWSLGDFDYEGMATMLKGLQLVKAVGPGPFDWSKIVDDSYLPDVLKRKPKS